MAEIEKQIKIKLLQKETQEIFERFNWRDDIEREIKALGYKTLWEDPDEKIYQNPKMFDILFYINWIDGVYSIYERNIKGDING